MSLRHVQPQERRRETKIPSNKPLNEKVEILRRANIPPPNQPPNATLSEEQRVVSEKSDLHFHRLTGRLHAVPCLVSSANDASLLGVHGPSDLYLVCGVMPCIHRCQLGLASIRLVNRVMSS